MIFSKEINILEIIFLNTIVNDIVYLKYWELQVRLIDNNYDTVLDKTYCNVGDTTTFQSVAQPELSEEGYSKFQSNMELHRNYMTTFRCDASWSSLYALQEEVFMRIADDTDKSKGESVYKMLKKEKELLDTFMYAMNTGLKTITALPKFF